jgi:hypothetical protein
MEFTNGQDLRCKCGRKVLKCYNSSDSNSLYFKLHFDEESIKNLKSNYVGVVCKKCKSTLYLEVGFKN